MEAKQCYYETTCEIFDQTTKVKLHYDVVDTDQHIGEVDITNIEFSEEFMECLNEKLQINLKIDYDYKKHENACDDANSAGLF